MKTKKQKKVKKVVKSLEEIPELLKDKEHLCVLENCTDPMCQCWCHKENPSIVAHESNEDPTERAKIVEEMTNVEPEPKEEPITNVNNCEYRLTLQFNNETYDCFTNNLKIGILSFAREVLTEMFVKITKGQAVFEKKLNLTQAKMLFNDMQSLEIFLENFYGLYGRPTSKQLM